MSAASIASLSMNAIDDEQNEKLKKAAQLEKSDAKIAAKKQQKEDKRFGYFYVGQALNVIVKTSAEKLKESSYLIVLNDTTKVKRNKKLLLRQLAILNENHMDGDSLNSLGVNKRKRADDDEEVLIKKKLLLSGEKGKKRRLDSEQNGEEDRDHIEIVANVKKAKKVEPAENGNANQAEPAFPWEVTDFDQFYELVNKVENQEDATNKSTDETKKAKKDKGNKTKPVRLDDRTIFEVNKTKLF